MIELAIVDDEESYATQLRGYIESYEKESGQSIHITEYRDGDDLVSQFHCQFDIILMDIQMCKGAGCYDSARHLFCVVLG